MSEIKHTPGPWAVFHDHPTVPEKIAFIRPASSAGYSGHDEIAEICGTGPDSPYAARRRANARLLAAAPELLAALDRLAHVAKLLGADQDEDGALQQAYDVIAKATGVQP